jgi:hypothetical protein
VIFDELSFRKRAYSGQIKAHPKTVQDIIGWLIPLASLPREGEERPEYKSIDSIGAEVSKNTSQGPQQPCNNRDHRSWAANASLRPTADRS